MPGNELIYKIMYALNCRCFSSVYSVEAITPVAGYIGRCELIIYDFSITIIANGNIVDQVFSRVFGTWFLRHISKFNLAEVGRYL